MTSVIGYRARHAARSRSVRRGMKLYYNVRKGSHALATISDTGAMLAVHRERESRGAQGPDAAPPRASRCPPAGGGICNTDLELQRGYYGFRGTPGHEFVGEVVEADQRALIGKRVVGEINLACRNCDWCARGLGRHCPHRTVLGIVKHPGAFRRSS